MDLQSEPVNNQSLKHLGNLLWVQVYGSLALTLKRAKASQEGASI